MSDIEDTDTCRQGSGFVNGELGTCGSPAEVSYPVTIADSLCFLRRSVGGQSANHCSRTFTPRILHFMMQPVGVDLSVALLTF